MDQECKPWSLSKGREEEEGWKGRMEAVESKKIEDRCRIG